MIRAQVLPEEVYLDPDEEDDLMADDVRDEDYYAARAVPRDPKKKKKKKKDKKERPTKPRLVLHWGREKLVETVNLLSSPSLSGPWTQLLPDGAPFFADGVSSLGMSAVSAWALPNGTVILAYCRAPDLGIAVAPRPAAWVGWAFLELL